MRYGHHDPLGTPAEHSRQQATGAAPAHACVGGSLVPLDPHTRPQPMDVAALGEHSAAASAAASGARSSPPSEQAENASAATIRIARMGIHAGDLLAGPQALSGGTVVSPAEQSAHRGEP